MTLRIRSTTACRLGQLAILASTLTAGTALAQTVVSACAQTLTGEGMLTADLDCTGFSPALTMGEDSSLALGGFTFTGPASCTGGCKFVGPGTIAGDIVASGEAGISIAASLRVEGDLRSDGTIAVDGSTVVGAVSAKDFYGRREAVIRDGSGIGIDADGVFLIQTTVLGHPGTGVRCTRCEILLSSVLSNGTGISCDRPGAKPGRIFADTPHFDGNTGHGVDCSGSVKLNGGTVHGNGGTGIRVLGANPVSGRPRGRLLVSFGHIQDNGVGIETYRAKLTDTDVTTSAFDGVQAEKIVLQRSSVHDNGSDPDCDVVVSCADLRSDARPRVLPGSTCGTSLDYSDATWGICASD